MAEQGKGSFEVKMTPQQTADPGTAAVLGRFALAKQYRGDLEATSQGEMLSAGTAVKGSAGYVAIEHVTGHLHGRNGSFALQHHGVMTRGVPQLSIMVVPDSGTDQLLGLAGTMQIDIADGKHSYHLQYTLDDGQA